MSTDAPESTDDLSKPLGQKPKKKKQRFVVPMWIVSRAIAGVLGLCVAVLAGWILFVDEPYRRRADGDGQRVHAHVATPAKPASRLRRRRNPMHWRADRARRRREARTDRHHHRRFDRQAPGSQCRAGRHQGRPEGRYERPRQSRTRRSIRAFSKVRVTAQIPKIAPDGARPSEVYAKPPKPQAARSDAPRIAIVIEGLGIGANSTTEALAKLPAEITVCVHALRRRSGTLGRARARRRPRSAAAGRHGAVRLSRQRSGAADLAHLQHGRAEHRPPALVLEPLSGICRRSPA